MPVAPPRFPSHRAGPSYRGKVAFSPSVVPHLPQPFSVAPEGHHAPYPYIDCAGGSTNAAHYTRSFSPGKFMAKVCTGNLQGIKTYLAEDGDINVRLTASELDVLHRELGGDPCRGNPSFARQVEAVEVDDTALHIAVRSGDKDIVKYLLSHGAEMHVPNGSGETAACLGDKCCVDVRSNFKLEARIEEIFDVIDENKDGWINEPEAIKFALLTTDNDEENAYTFWRVLQSTQGGSPTGLVSKATWVSFFLSHFAGAQVAVALSQLQEVLDQISLIRGQAIGQTMLASRTTPLRTINNVHWVSGIRSSWAPGDRRVTAESFRPRSTGHPFVPLFF